MSHIVTASEGTPEDVDLEAATARLRNQLAGQTVEASTMVFGDGIAHRLSDPAHAVPVDARKL